MHLESFFSFETLIPYIERKFRGSRQEKKDKIFAAQNLCRAKFRAGEPLVIRPISKDFLLAYKQGFPALWALQLQRQQDAAFMQACQQFTQQDPRYTPARHDECFTIGYDTLMPDLLDAWLRGMVDNETLIQFNFLLVNSLYTNAISPLTAWCKPDNILFYPLLDPKEEKFSDEGQRYFADHFRKNSVIFRKFYHYINREDMYYTHPSLTDKRLLREYKKLATMHKMVFALQLNPMQALMLVYGTLVGVQGQSLSQDWCDILDCCEFYLRQLQQSDPYGDVLQQYNISEIIAGLKKTDLDQHKFLQEILERIHPQICQKTKLYGVMCRLISQHANLYVDVNQKQIILVLLPIKAFLLTVQHVQAINGDNNWVVPQPITGINTFDDFHIIAQPKEVGMRAVQIYDNSKSIYDADGHLGTAADVMVHDLFFHINLISGYSKNVYYMFHQFAHYIRYLHPKTDERDLLLIALDDFLFYRYAYFLDKDYFSNERSLHNSLWMNHSYFISLIGLCVDQPKKFSSLVEEFVCFFDANAIFNDVEKILKIHVADPIKELRKNLNKNRAAFADTQEEIKILSVLFILQIIKNRDVDNIFQNKLDILISRIMQSPSQLSNNIQLILKDNYLAFTVYNIPLQPDFESSLSEEIENWARLLGDAITANSVQDNLTAIPPSIKCMPFRKS